METIVISIFIVLLATIVILSILLSECKSKINYLSAESKMLGQFLFSTDSSYSDIYKFLSNVKVKILRKIISTWRFRICDFYSKIWEKANEKCIEQCADRIEYSTYLVKHFTFIQSIPDKESRNVLLNLFTSNVYDRISDSQLANIYISMLEGLANEINLNKKSIFDLIVFFLKGKCVKTSEKNLYNAYVDKFTQEIMHYKELNMALQTRQNNIIKAEIEFMLIEFGIPDVVLKQILKPSSL